MSSGPEAKLGDEVSTRIHGEKRTGPVTDTTPAKEEAEEKGNKCPPKVTLRDQHGKF